MQLLDCTHSLQLSWLAALLLLSASVQGVVRVERPPRTQLPTIARFGQPYTWSFAHDTFTDINATAPLLYHASGLPAWANFEPAGLSISGTPPLSPTGPARINDTVTLTATNPKTGSTASTPFYLITMNGTGPVVNKPLAQQLPNVTTLGSRSILPSGAQLLLLGWSFSLGFAADTFKSDSRRFYVSARLADGSPLPDWMHFDQTVTLWGLAPTDVHTAGSFYTVVITASDVPGYAGVNSSFQMVVSGASLVQAAPFPAINATAGQSFQSALPLDSIVDSQGRAINASSLRVTANTSSVGSWLSYDEASQTFSGTPPFNLTEAGPLSFAVPVTLINAANQRAAPVPASASITVYPSPFSGWSLPNLRVAPDKMFQIGLGEFLRSAQTPPQVSFSPTNDWISFDPTTMMLMGTPPKSGFEPVQVQVSVEASNPSGYRGVSTESFTITQLSTTTTAPARLPVPSRTAASESSSAASTNSADGFSSSASSSDASTSGLSSKAKFAIAASLGGVGGLVMLILLMVCCRRYCAAEDRHFRGAHPDDSQSDCEKSYNGHGGDDDRTLADERSPRFGWASLKKDRKSKDEHSPYLDPYAALAADGAYGADRSPFSDAMTLAPSDEGHGRRLSDGNPRQVVTKTANVAPAAFAPAPAFVITNASPLAVEKPKRSSVLNLFARATKTPKSNRSINNLTTGGNDAPLARPTSIGLGLEGMLDRDLSQMTTSKSLANRSSWESNLFYDETMDRGVSSAAAPGTPERRRSEALRKENLSLDSPLEVPVRRGSGGPPMRHRNAHISTSPAFNLAAGFESSPERDETVPKRSAAAGHGRARGGSVDLDDAVVEYARKVSVDVSGTMTPPQQVSIQQGQRNLSQHLENYMHQPSRGSFSERRARSTSQTTQEEDAFEDAEDDPSDAAVMRTTVENTKRNSAASYVPDLAGAETSAVRYTDSRRSSAVGAVSTPVRTRGMAPRRSEDEPRGPSVRAVRQTSAVASASPVIPGAGATRSGILTRADPQTPVRATRAEGASSAGSSASRGAALFQTSQSTTTTQARPSHRRSDSSSRFHPPAPSTPWSTLRTHTVATQPGALIRIAALTGTAAPPMLGGAPGSPGKRSGRKLSYHPVLQDEKYFEYYNTWPEFLHWLKWDERMQELSGTVPVKFGPLPLRLKLAILARGAVGGGNESPTRGGAHRRTGSNVSTGSNWGAGSEDEVAAIVVLDILKREPATPGRAM